MATIKVDAETLRAKAGEIRNLREEQDNTIQKIGALINGLSDVFQGQAATAYTQQFESMRPTFTQFSELVAKFATELDGVANTFTETDTSLAGSLSH